MNEMRPMTPRLMAFDENCSRYDISSWPAEAPNVSTAIMPMRSLNGWSTPNAERNAKRNVRHGMIAVSVE